MNSIGSPGLTIASHALVGVSNEATEKVARRIASLVAAELNASKSSEIGLIPHLSVSQFAYCVGVHEDTVRNWIRKDRHSIRTSRLVRHQRPIRIDASALAPFGVSLQVADLKLRKFAARQAQRTASQPDPTAKKVRGVRKLAERSGRPSPYGVQWQERIYDVAAKRMVSKPRSMFFATEPARDKFYNQKVHERRAGMLAEIPSRKEIADYRAFKQAAGGTPWHEIISGYREHVRKADASLTR